jgi:putative membrane protein
MHKKNYIHSFIAPGGKKFWLLMTIVFIYCAFVIWIDDHGFPAKTVLESDSALTIGGIMGLLLVFRTNSAYERWWEARKLWGQLVNEIRNLSIKTQAVLANDQDKYEFIKLLLAFPYSLKNHLRGGVFDLKVFDLHAQKIEPSHFPQYIASLASQNLYKWKTEGKIDGFIWLELDLHARALMDICGSCERILKSPIAGAYKQLIWHGIIIYMVLAPWLIIPLLDNWTLVAVILSAYFILGVELLAEEVEEPFGTQTNDLPLETICSNISISIKEIFPQLNLDLHQ